MAVALCIVGKEYHFSCAQGKKRISVSGLNFKIWRTQLIFQGVFVFIISFIIYYIYYYRYPSLFMLACNRVPIDRVVKIQLLGLFLFFFTIIKIIKFNLVQQPLLIGFHCYVQFHTDIFCEKQTYYS